MVLCHWVCSDRFAMVGRRLGGGAFCWLQPSNYLRKGTRHVNRLQTHCLEQDFRVAMAIGATASSVRCSAIMCVVTIKARGTAPMCLATIRRLHVISRPTSLVHAAYPMLTLATTATF
jgi:hypothetical protein